MTDSTDPVLIIGAGVAGLSAVTTLRAAGIGCVAVEAADRIGGRTHTTLFGGHAFDHGASWLHASERNPLTGIARAAHVPLLDCDAVRTRRVLVDGQPATSAQIEARSQAYARFEAVASAETRDIALADAIASLRADPWTATIEAWEGCQIAAADPRDLSVIDWRMNALEGANLNIQGGLGTFVAHTLGPMAGAVALNTPVHAIDWRGPITAQTSAGTIRASACIVTASPAAIGRIRFQPALPMSLDGLPMGLLTKIALHATGADRLGLRPDESVTARIERDAPMLSLLAWPNGSDHVVAFIGGPPAWALAREGQAATIAFVRDRLRAWFGARADSALGEAIVTDWHSNPWHGGAYAYARAGHAQDRARLAEPLADGRLVFAGEATADQGLAGTVGGAWNEGKRAAAIVRAAVSRRA